MRQDRFLLGILVGIILLVVVSLALFYTRQNQAAYVPDDTPQGAVQDYVLAVQKGDYQRAYQYIQDSAIKPDEARFRQSFSGTQLNISGTSLEVEPGASINGSRATVPVTVISAGGGLFSSVNRRLDVATLVLQNGAWKIENIPYPYWDYSWYQPPVKPASP